MSGSLVARIAFSLSCLAALGCSGSPSQLSLRSVVLYQNGIGYFEHRGSAPGQHLELSFRRYEIGDVLKTITIVPIGGVVGDSAVAALTTTDPRTLTDQAWKDLPPEARTDEKKSASAAKKEVTDRIGLSIALTEAAPELAIAYAVPTAAWKPSYRVVLPDTRGQGDALLQGWASINNTSDSDWNDVQLTLATGAPLSFAIDLMTPRFVPRPDITGTLVQPVATGAIGSSSARAGDGDGDGIPDLDDLCLNDPEDLDGFEDKDGCSDPDNDKDRVLDASDQCPNDPETYNGIDDEDGCPDRGRVMVTDTRIEILDKVYFSHQSATVRSPSMPIVDAIAATLIGNPDIGSIAIQGHAARGEKDAWGLSQRRAAAVQVLLRERGVTTELVAEPYAATQPIDPGKSEAARAKNRRVEFLILSRRNDEPAEPKPARVTRANLQKSVRTRVEPRDVAGTVRYQIGDPVSIPRGASALVPIINQNVVGEDIFLYRPDPAAPASQNHPWRAARIDNRTGLQLQPGPVAIFSEGAFVGEGLLERLHEDETAFIPYALDSSCTISVHADSGERPVRIVSAERGRVTVHNRLQRITRYQVRTGARAPARALLHHARYIGYEASGLPPRTETSSKHYLVPLPLSAGKESAIEIVEEQTVKRTIHILDAGSDKRLQPYLGDGDLPKQIGTQLRAVMTLRTELTAVDRELDGLRRQLVDVGRRADEVRASLQAIGKTPQAAKLRRELVASLTETTARTEAISRDLAARSATRAELRARLGEALHKLSFQRK